MNTELHKFMLNIKCYKHCKHTRLNTTRNVSTLSIIKTEMEEKLYQYSNNFSIQFHTQSEHKQHSVEDLVQSFCK